MDGRAITGKGDNDHGRVGGVSPDSDASDGEFRVENGPSVMSGFVSVVDAELNDKLFCA